jgi:hypothetical protein
VNLVNLVNVEGMTVGPRRPGPTVASELASSAERSFRRFQCAHTMEASFRSKGHPLGPLFHYV